MHLQFVFVISLLFLCFIRFQHSIVRSPWIQLEKHQSKTGNEVVCSSSQFYIGTIYFYESERLVVEIWNNGSVCRLNPEKLHIHLRCGCRGVASTLCNITVDHSNTGCQTWRCAAVIDGVLTFSNFVDICDHVSTSTSTARSPSTTDVYQYMNCNSTNIVNRVVEKNRDLFEIKKYYRDNISMLIDSFKSEDDGSIETCKVEEPAEEEWAISILYPFEVCETSILVDNKSLRQTCQYRHGNPNITVKVETVSTCPLITTTSRSEINISLCEFVNQNDLGERKFVDYATGLFKVEILYPATILQYDITIEEIRSHAWNVTSDGLRYIRFNCHGNGNPSPIMTLIKEKTVLVSQNTHLQHKIHLSSKQESNIYTCIAWNGLGSDNKSIVVNPQPVVSNSRRENIPTINNMVIYVVSGVVALALVCLLIHLLLRRVSCYRPLRCTEIGSLTVRMVAIETSEQIAPEMQTTDEGIAIRTGSVHLYESIPPSPIADVSFSDVSEDIDIDSDLADNRVVQFAETGRYEILDRNRREDMTTYINLQI
ncbi:uncharacterized protein LOC127867207 [Dreissena polymorpha]|uniref:uncharacterized protein LOC127867207 n=1 Tax=Dreissena polymorpha TaxID=45954 RepID=UPI00226484D4|nr:uncharacterized protein LOC127867207 [Dreissena polymorpha]